MEKTSDAALRLEGLTRSFVKDGKSVKAVDDVTLEIGREHRMVSLIGPDGAGKSTLLRLIAGILKPDAGRCVHAHDGVLGPSDIGYMSQNLGLYEDLSVMENLRLFAALRNARRAKSVAPSEEAAEGRDASAASADKSARADSPAASPDSPDGALLALLERVDLLRFKDRKAGSLSGGMKQKLALTCAISAEPKLLLLDEPTVGVDPLSRRELWNIIEEYLENRDALCIFSSLYLEESERSTLTVFMRQGRIIRTGSADRLKESVRGRCFTLDTAPLPLQRCVGALMCMTVRHGSDVIRDICPRLGRIDLLCAPGRGRKELALELKRLFDLAIECGMLAKAPDPDAVKERASVAEDAYIDLTGSFRATGSDLPDAAPVSTGDARDDAVIRVSHIKKIFGSFVAVDDSSFSVRRGEIFGLLGPNGAGKTTTFRMICALLRPSAGSVRINGFDLATDTGKIRATIGYVAQKFCLYRNLTPLQNMRYFGESYGLEGETLRRRIAMLSSTFNLTPFMNESSGGLPFGVQRSLSMACALIHGPAILFLDEATSGADPSSRRTFWSLISHLAASGTTIIVTTHFMEEAEYCDRFLIQDQGRILVLGSPDDICKRETKRLSVEEAFTELVLKQRDALAAREAEHAEP